MCGRQVYFFPRIYEKGEYSHWPPFQERPLSGTLAECSINSTAHMLAVSLLDIIIPSICFLSYMHFSTCFGDCMYFWGSLNRAPNEALIIHPSWMSPLLFLNIFGSGFKVYLEKKNFFSRQRVFVNSPPDLLPLGTLGTTPSAHRHWHPQRRSWTCEHGPSVCPGISPVPPRFIHLLCCFSLHPISSFPSTHVLIHISRCRKTTHYIVLSEWKTLFTQTIKYSPKYLFIYSPIC